MQSAQIYERDLGRQALRPLDPKFLLIADLEEFGVCRMSTLLDSGEPPLRLHYSFWDDFTRLLFQIRKRFQKECGTGDVVQIARHLCSDLI